MFFGNKNKIQYPEIFSGSVNSDNAASENLLIIPGNKHEDIQKLIEQINNFFKVLVLTSELPAVERVQEYAELIYEKLQKMRVKRLVILGIGSGGSIAQALALTAQKIVRRVILIDSCTRLVPTIFDRVVDFLENFLPLGLPLRSLSRAFDSRSQLHRIHRPVLVLLSPEASDFEQSQAALIAERAATAWKTELKESAVTHAGELSEELQKIIIEFSQIPGKRPLKNAA